jgi:DNA-binding CsgD family transcriptional regulator/PAS domain-containing protein
VDIGKVTKLPSTLIPLASPEALLRTEHLTTDNSLHPYRDPQSAQKESVVQIADEADDMFTHAPVSLWEEDFSEVKHRFCQLKAVGVEDLRKHFKKNPEEVLALARMVRIVRINKQTLALYDAAGPVEFRQGLSPIFNKDSFEVFKEELIAFWKGTTSFASEAVNLTLAGTIKNILIHAIIPPGYEESWAKVYVAITDITAIKDSMKSLASSEQKYRSVFDATLTAIVLVDATSGVIREANRSARKLLGASNGVDTGEQPLVRALFSQMPERPGLSGQVLHINHNGSSKTPVKMSASTIEMKDARVVMLTFYQVDDMAPMKRRGNHHPAGMIKKKLSQRECEILRHICNGSTSRTIAQSLAISEKTVRTHRTRLMQKLDMHCVVDLVKFAMSTGLARPH